MNYKSEQELIQKAIEGDKQALTEIVKQNEQLVYNTALKLLANTDEAECVLQETFLKVFQALPTFKGQSSLSTWIYRIATNFALMKLRSKKKNFTGIEDLELKTNQDALQAFKTDPWVTPLFRMPLTWNYGKKWTKRLKIYRQNFAVYLF